jgi:hypothetical protein
MELLKWNDEESSCKENCSLCIKLNEHFQSEIGPNIVQKMVETIPTHKASIIIEIAVMQATEFIVVKAKKSVFK